MDKNRSKANKIMLMEERGTTAERRKNCQVWRWELLTGFSRWRSFWDASLRRTEKRIGTELGIHPFERKGWAGVRGKAWGKKPPNQAWKGQTREVMEEVEGCGAGRGEGRWDPGFQGPSLYIRATSLAIRHSSGYLMCMFYSVLMTSCEK